MCIRDSMNTYDYIVIGAGSSGAVLASRLSENPNNKVLLIEAGDTFEKIEEIPDVIKNGMATGADWTGNLAVGTDYDWKYEAVSNDNFKNMGVPRGKVIGGTSSINGQVFLRAIPEDFQNWKSKENTCIYYVFTTSRQRILVRCPLPNLQKNNSGIHTAIWWPNSSPGHPKIHHKSIKIQVWTQDVLLGVP